MVDGWPPKLRGAADWRILVPVQIVVDCQGRSSSIASVVHRRKPGWRYGASLDRVLYLSILDGHATHACRMHDPHGAYPPQ